MIPTLPLPPLAATEGAPVGKIENVPEPAAWLTVQVTPGAMVNIPERGLQPSLAIAFHVNVPLPLPVVGVQVSQLDALLVGVQEHVLPAVTLNEPLPPMAAAEAVDAETA